MINSGIYFIKNIQTNDFYIGSSINLSKRQKTHFKDLEKNKHHSLILQRAYNKYGKNNFIFEVIFNCQSEYCLEFENYFIKLYNPYYNISKDAKSPMKGRKHTKESIEKFKKIKRPSGKDCYMYGKKWSDELRRKILTKRTGSKRTKETKLKMSETAKRINSIARVDREKQQRKIIDNDGIIYKSLVDAAKNNNISVATVCDILKGRHFKTRKGKSFKYYES